MQESLAHLELEGNGPRGSTGPQSPDSYIPGRADSLGVAPSNPSARLIPQGSEQPGYNPAAASNSYIVSPRGQDSSHYGATGTTDYNSSEQPTFSPFPQLRNPPPNVPPSDEEKEATLEQARMPVLNSSDAEMQLTWAQDALAYVEIAMQLESRLSDHQAPRSQTPQVEHQLRVDAVNIVGFLADQHHPKAEFMRGMWLEFGKFGFRADKKEAYRCYARAADKGYARAEYRMGMQYESSNDPEKAVKHYKRGVQMGDSASNYRLGMMTLLGQHKQPQDFRRGLDHIRFAAETADENAPQGAYVYGMLQARELEHINIPEMFLPLDLNEARTNIEKAAYLGFAKAQVKMGAAYELCQLGCEFNPALSLHYNALAARQGESVAEMAVSKWFLCGYEGVFDKNEELAYTFALRAASTGLPTAEFAMGYFYEIGIVVAANMEEAKRWYQKAATRGNKDALGRIDGISRSKTLSRRDHDKIAIQKIKSQYGSQRGRRPSRFQVAAEQMPSIPDDRLAMPDPSGPSNYLSQPTGGQPPRSQSAMAAPYPLEGQPLRNGPRPGTATGFINPALRPSSASGMRPHVRPATASNAGTHAFGAQPQHVMSTPAGLGLPSTGDPDINGRVSRVRAVSSNTQVPASWNRADAATGDLRQEILQKPLPRLDIGYSAPPELAMDRRNRLQKPQTPISGRPQPQAPLPQSEYEFGSETDLRVPSRASNVSQPQGFDNRARPASAQSLSAYSASTRPSRSRPGSVETGAVPDGSPPTSHKTSRPAIHPAAVPPRAPGTGPKTFEEMGVPQAKKESDCVGCYSFSESVQLY